MVVERFAFADELDLHTGGGPAEGAEQTVERGGGACPFQVDVLEPAVAVVEDAGELPGGFAGGRCPDE